MTEPPIETVIWVFDHTDTESGQCGNKYRIRTQDVAEFQNRNRGTCPTCLLPLPDPRPATEEDWE